jgi:hypothetical protein
MRKNIGSQQPDRALTCGDAKVRFHEKSAPVIKKDRVGSSLVRYFEVASTSHSVFSNSWRGDKSMQRYDPLVAPDPEEWLALDEQERMVLARNYHHGARIRVPNALAHAALHAIVENQIALRNETPARRTAQRLMDAGLDRHEAIHAIGWVLVEYMADLMDAPESDTDPNAPYFAALERLTVEDWRRSQ